MKIRLTFYMHVPDSFATTSYGTAVGHVRELLSQQGLETSVWRIDFEPTPKPIPPTNCNGPTGAPS